MGLRRIQQKDETSYMYSNVSIPEEIRIVLLRNKSAFSVQLTTESEAVKKWCRNLQKDPEEYMALLHVAVETCHVTCSGDEESNKTDVFEIQEDCLVWKQYFPDKNVYGRRGKFLLDEITYEEAMMVVLDGAVADLDTKASCIQKLSDDLEKSAKELQRAIDLTAECVVEKEAFEKEIYGKCASLINAKKLRIRQLMSSRPSVSGEQSTAVKKILSSPQSADQESKGSKSGDANSDGYSSDTDVDDPDADDIDTDEEMTYRVASQKRKAESKSRPKPPRQVYDSQDDLFNNSLDAELYSTNKLQKKQKLTEDGSGKAGTSNSNGNKLSSGGSTSEGFKPGGQSSSLSSLTSDSQRSIIEELF